MNLSFREKLNRIIFESDTKSGRFFDVLLLWLIVFSVLIVILESVEGIRLTSRKLFLVIEWILTGIFTIEYALRIFAARKPFKYIFSFYGIVDLLAILPAYIGIVFTGAQSLLIIRAFRLLRVFRILKINRYFAAGQMLLEALKASRAKISVFLFAVVTVVLLMGTLIYLIEGEENGFKNIPLSVYWAIVTLTTVGYGDITPQTMPGQLLSGILMILGYAIIAVPTGIISVEMARSEKKLQPVCSNCGNEKNDSDAVFCKNCGEKL